MTDESEKYPTFWEVARRVLAEMKEDERRSIQQCTGYAAGWCPICGECTCHRLPDGEREYDERCPLHGEFSDHATLREPPVDDYETLGYPETQVGETTIEALAIICRWGFSIDAWRDLLPIKKNHDDID